MDIIDTIMTDPHDHIMANTWRLIFEGDSQGSTATRAPAIPDFSFLEQILPEYRLIGLHLAQDVNQRPN